MTNLLPNKVIGKTRQSIHIREKKVEAVAFGMAQGHEPATKLAYAAPNFGADDGFGAPDYPHPLSIDTDKCAGEYGTRSLNI